MSKYSCRVVCVAALGLAARSVWAAPPPSTSLNDCQNAVKSATQAFVTNKVAAIGGCLQAVSTQIVKSDKPDASGAAATCVTQFRKLNDSRGMDKQLSDKLAAAIVKKCDPAYQTPSGAFPNTHTLADIIGAGAGVAQPLDAENLNAYCSHYGGDGSIDTLQEWIDCITAAAECDVDSAIASQYPRAIEWLNLVKPSMQALSAPATDPTKVTDAVAGLAAVKAELDGPNNDNVVSIQCGRDACGNGSIDAGESCDQGNLNNKTCVTQGFAGGTLKCGANCAFDTSGCYAARFVDNANGTITDNQSGLQWEKKVKLDGATDFANLQDADNSYRWAGQCTMNLGKYCQPTAAAATACAAGVEGDPMGCAQCTGGDGTCNAATTAWTWVAALNTANFGAHSDWRLPKRAELEGILDLADTTSPVVNVAFQGASCGGSCTDITSAACSCTQSDYYWSSSSFAVYPDGGWVVYFVGGEVTDVDKPINYYVRAVRGGS